MLPALQIKFKPLAAEAILILSILNGALNAVPPAQTCVGLPMERHGYGSYIHADDAAKAKLPGVKLDPDWSPHIMDDPGDPHIPPDWCARKAGKAHANGQGQQKVP